MQLRIRNKAIVTPIYTILTHLRKELGNGKLKDIIDDKSKQRNVVCTCINHKDGFEARPSMSVFSDLTDPDIEYGKCHCFTCGYTASLPQMIADVFNEDLEFGEDWLLENFGDVFIDECAYLQPIELNSNPIKKVEDDSILVNYDFYHPYMWHRKLSKAVVDEFRVGYDKERDAITFPVYDEKHRYVFTTARCVNTKMFYIPEGVDKPVYLLYDLIEKGITTAFVCESQINTLFFRTLFPGYYSIGLFGTGSYNQLEILKKSGIRNYILLFDGDEGGRKGANRFIKTLGKDCWITDVKIPWGKDINDLTKEEILELLSKENIYLQT